MRMAEVTHPAPAVSRQAERPGTHRDQRRAMKRGQPGRRRQGRQAGPGIVDADDHPRDGCLSRELRISCAAAGFLTGLLPRS